MMEAKNVELAAVMDVDADAVERVAKKYGVAKKYRVMEHLLADSDIQAVYIATPVHVHRDQVVAAAQAGKHVLVEKPLALTVPLAEDVVAAGREHNVKITEGYMMKFQRLHQKARSMVEEGAIGKVVFARAQLSCWYPDIPGAWRQVPQLGGGGALMDMATHCYDLLGWIIGSEIKEVFAFADTQTFKYPVDDSSTSLLKFEQGAHGVVDCFFNVPDAAGQDRLELYGTKGSIQAEGTIGQVAGGKMVAYLSDEAKGYDAEQSKSSLEVTVRQVTSEPKNMYASEVEYLSECIEQGRDPELNTAEAGVKVLRAAVAAYESARTGRRIVL
jgi:predicted dehydrogenase